MKTLTVLTLLFLVSLLASPTHPVSTKPVSYYKYHNPCIFKDTFSLKLDERKRQHIDLQQKIVIINKFLNENP